MSALPPTTDDVPLWDLYLSLYRLPVVTVADEVGTFAALSGQAMTTADLALALGVEPRALGIHLGLLAAMGFVERRLGLWRSSATARTWLHPEGGGYWGPLLFGYRHSQPLHAQLMATLKPEMKAQTHVSAVAEWERGEMDKDLADRIAAFMNSHSIAAAKAVARHPVFGQIKSLLDIGGGSGVFSIETARAWPALQASVLDIGAICVAARGYIDAAGLSDRVRTLAVDMFRQDWPEGHDALFFSNIFHDWSDDTCRLLAHKAFDALPPGGSILLHEILIDDDGCGPLTAAAFSLLMLLGTKGKQYTLAELTGFLEGAGFVDVGSSQTGGGAYSLVSARKP